MKKLLKKQYEQLKQGKPSRQRCEEREFKRRQE